MERRSKTDDDSNSEVRPRSSVAKNKDMIKYTPLTFVRGDFDFRVPTYNVCGGGAGASRIYFRYIIMEVPVFCVNRLLTALFVKHALRDFFSSCSHFYCDERLLSGPADQYHLPNAEKR